MFRRVTGRDRGRSDRLFAVLARIQRWSLDPRGLFQRLRDRFVRPARPEVRPRCVRLCIVVQYPIHNHLPLHRALAREPDLDLQVLFMQRAWSSSGHEPELGSVVDWGLPMLEGYASEVFPNWSPRCDGDGFWKYVNPKLVWRVLTGPWDAVYVHGHNHFTHVAAIIAARLGAKRAVIRTDTYNLGERPLHVRLLRALAYRGIYRLAHVLLYVGEHNRCCFEEFGARPGQLVHAPQVVDNARFDAERARLAPRRGAIKAAFGIDADRKIVLFCAKFVAKKQPLMLIDAFLDADLGDGWVLLMVGDGPLRGECEARAVVRGAGVRVVFAGFLDQNEVGRGYAVADMLVLPSAWQETWGLVVNEAMNFGCPVIVSDRVGSAPDLVAGKCGLVFAHDRPDALIAALQRMAGDSHFRARCGDRARAVIAAWSVEQYLAGVRRALGLPDRTSASVR